LRALARIAGYAYVLDAARRLTASSLDHGSSLRCCPRFSNITPQTQRTALNDALTSMAAAPSATAAHYLFGTYMSVPVAITVEGANILTRSLMIFGQGAIRCHPYLLKEMEAANLA